MKNLQNVLRSSDGVAVLLTLLVTAAISVIGLSLILITEVDTKISLATQINKENLNVGDGALQRALDVLRERPTMGYKEYPWEGALPPTAQMRLNTDTEADGSSILENGILATGSLSSPTYVDNIGQTVFDGYSATPYDVSFPAGSVHPMVSHYGELYVLNDNSGDPMENVVMRVGLGETQSTSSYAYYTVFVEAVQGDSDWNTAVATPTPYTLNWANHVPDGLLNAADFDKYQILVRARIVGLYGSVKDLVMIVKVVKPDGSPYGDEPGSTQGGTQGPTGGVVTFTQS